MVTEELKRIYASLIVKNCLNVKKGQRLVINCPVETADFARMCADAAYEAGCKEVLMNWRDDYLSRAKYLHADDSVFDKVDEWIRIFCDTVSEEGAAWLAIHADNPENLKGVNPDRIRRAQMASGAAMENFRKREMSNQFPWCVASIPTAAWAKAVFPDLSTEKAEERLWEEILKACYVDGPDAPDNWAKHSAELRRRVEVLNSLNLVSLRYTNSLGTDLTVQLPEGHFWAGGSEDSADGSSFSANIPTEEVFTLPHKHGVNGKLYASRPLCLNGNMIENFNFTFKDGKIVELHAEKGEQILRDSISLDEGASFLGEVALVPYHSPISMSGVLFLNTLFDENASCHFAFGAAYPCIKGAETMTEEQLAAAGVNNSMTHVDFMVGTPDLSIIGKDHTGKEVVIFENGDFVI